YKLPDGKTGRFVLSQWALSNGVEIMEISGFNSPKTALPDPPINMTSLDQSAFFLDGMDMDALQELYPKAQTLADGRVVVLDHDGLWKTMWSKDWTPPLPPPEYSDRVDQGQAVDLEMGIRTAGITMLFALAGIEPRRRNQHDYSIASLVKALKIINRNAPYENK